MEMLLPWKHCCHGDAHAGPSPHLPYIRWIKVEDRREGVVILPMGLIVIEVVGYL